MHRMGDAKSTKTKLKNWSAFRGSLLGTSEELKPLRGADIRKLSEREYFDIVSALEPAYKKLRLAESDATIVVNSKALFHLLPNLIPPVDRQYTVRFFQQAPNAWRDAKGKFKTVTLPSDIDSQFQLFRSICLGVMKLVNQVDDALLEGEFRTNGVTPPKAIDNAIVNFVRIVAGNESGEVSKPFLVGD